ncbi:MAG: type II toxin-antitoxin system VapC family toxin [Rhodospirillales bacterium]|nr:type II toxin-antitoxin system VapC family toxin [Rhodospirillales bacterium]
MIYFDTSFLVPLLLPEATSDKVARFLRALPAPELTISHWVRVEFSSLLGREVRMGGLAPAMAARADAQFEAMIAKSFVILLPDGADFDRAKEFLGRPETGLRAGDALHLAIAANHRAKAVYSLDTTLIKAGRILGLPVSAGIRPS